jgi:hypothetical protein
LDAAPAEVQIADFFAGDSSSRAGVQVAVGSVSGSTTADLATMNGGGGRVSVYTSATVLSHPAPAPDQMIDPTNGVFVG